MVIPYGTPFFLAFSAAFDQAGKHARYIVSLNLRNANSSNIILDVVRPLPSLSA